MSVYQQYCQETFDDAGRLQQFRLTYPDSFNFGYDVVDRIAEETPDKRAMIWCNVEGDERVFTFADVKRHSNRMANVFHRAGIGRGDRVMLILKRHYSYWFAAIALHKLGAVMIPATHMLTVQDLVYRIKASNVKGIVCTAQDGVTDRVLAARQATEMSAMLWCVGAPVDGFADLTAAAERESEELTRIPTAASDPLLMYFTSGTTGYPKGVIHDHTYPLAHIVTAKYWQRAEEDGLHFSVAETGWAKASWGKIYGQWLVGSAVMVYDFDNFEPKQLTAVINRYGVTSFCAPPTVYRYLVRKGIPAMPTLKHASTAGEMLAPDVFRAFRARTGIPLCEGYGQTETTLLMANFAGHDAVAGSMGTPSPFYRIALRGKDGGPVAAGEVGEIVVLPDPEGKQPGIFTAYLDHAEQYRFVWRDGVYHTGDAASMDESGNYWFHGRFDDIIKTGGFRVGPDEVEHVLMAHPDVTECSVIGVPDPLRGQAIKAFVVLSADCLPSPERARELKHFCNQKLAEYKWIRQIEFVAELPKTISGKIRKTMLRAQASAAEQPCARDR